jgi:uncharacterized protein (DUF488 family)
MTFPFFTIGHSTRPLGEFIDLLAASEVGLIVDARKFIAGLGPGGNVLMGA